MTEYDARNIVIPGSHPEQALLRSLYTIRKAIHDLKPATSVTETTTQGGSTLVRVGGSVTAAANQILLLTDLTGPVTITCPAAPKDGDSFEVWTDRTGLTWAATVVGQQYTTTTGFTQPSAGGTVSAPLIDTTKLVAGWFILIGGNRYRIASVPDATHAVLTLIPDGSNPQLPGAGVPNASSVAAPIDDQSTFVLNTAWEETEFLWDAMLGTWRVG